MFQAESEEIIDIEKNSAINSIVLTIKQIGITVCEIDQEFLRTSECNAKYYFYLKNKSENDNPNNN